MVRRHDERAAQDAAGREQRQQQAPLGVGEVEVGLDLRQGAVGKEGEKLVREADQQERTEQTGRGPDDGGQEDSPG